MIQNGLTVIVPIKPAKHQELRNLLTNLGNNIQKTPHLDWRQSPSTHFARFVILDPDYPDRPNGKVVPSLKNEPLRLLYTSNYDGTFDDYMKELVDTFGASMEPIWNKCEGYTFGTSTDVKKFSNFILSHSHLKRNAAPEAFYIACRGVTVEEMRRSIAIREALDRLLSDPQTQQLLKNPSNLVPRSSQPAAPPPPRSRFAGIMDRLGSLASGLAEKVIGIRGGLNPNLPVTSPQTQLAMEDRVTQNQMTVIVPVRPDFKARKLLPIVLSAVNKVGAKSTGSLSGLTTIHFARWAIIDGGRNLFFESNYDGSWENYIDDFVDRASLGMNLIWGNCTGFPHGGCKDIEWFKKYIRENQIPAQVFYSAYRDSSIKNNLNDLQVARAVQRVLTPQEVDALLSNTYVLTQQTLKQLMSEPATGLFLSGSYNRGVARALTISLESNPEGSGLGGSETGTSSGVKNLGKPLCLLAGAGLMAYWLYSRRA